MNIDEKIAALRSFEIFHTLTNEDLVDLAEYTQDKTFPKGTILIKEGEKENEMYFIISGLVRIYHLHESGKEMTISMRMPIEVVGEMSLIDEEPRSATVEALQETQVLLLSKEHFLLILEKHPRIGLHFLKLLSTRLREALRVQKSIVFESLEERTYHILQILSPHFPADGIELSHDELSTLINATQPRVTEVLNGLEKENKITLSRKKILVHK